jgi:hypothetical protein
MKGVLEEIRDLLKQGLPDAAREGAPKIKLPFEGLRIKIPVDFEPGSFDPPSGFAAPSAQTGGMVTKTGLVNVHAGEVIGPLNELDLGREVRIDNRLFIDGREVTASIVRHLREEARRQGVRPI